MPTTFEELAKMLAKRDGLSVEEELAAINIAAEDMEIAFFNGDLDACEDILREDLGLEPEYLIVFIN